MTTVMSQLRVITSRITSRIFSTKYLLVTNVASFGVLMGTGDIAVQQIVRLRRINDETVPKHDWVRTGRMVAIGLFMGPLNHGWYTCLDKVLPSVRLGVVGKKILLDQLIAAPFFMFLFIVGTSLLEKQNKQNCLQEFRSKFWEIYKADWLLWPAAQAVNFLFVPPQFRVVYVGAVTFFWDSFLSYIKHRNVAFILREKDQLSKAKSSSTVR